MRTPRSGNIAEKRAATAHRARSFCIPRGDITAAAAAQRYIDNLAAIARAAREPGPFIYGVYPDKIERLKIQCEGRLSAVLVAVGLYVRLKVTESRCGRRGRQRAPPARR